MDSAIFTISNLVVALTCAVLIFILVRYGAKRIHYILSLFNVTVGIWALGAFLVGLTSAPRLAFIYWKVALLGAIFSPIVFYHVIVGIAELRRKAVLIISYSYGLVFYALTLFDMVGLKVVKIPAFVYYVRATDYTWPGLVGLWACILLCAMIELYRLLKRCHTAKRIQYQYLIVSSALGFSGALLDTLPFFGFDPVPWANILMCLYSVLVTYAILRHKLLEIEVVIKKTIVFAGLFVSIYAVFVFFAFVGQVFFERFITTNRWLAMIPSVLVVTFMLRPLESYLINVTDRFLFQKRYDYKELLKTFTAEVLTVLNLDKLVDLTIDKLVDIMKLESCAVLLFNKDRQEFVVRASHNIKDPSLALVKPDAIVTFMQVTHGHILVPEIKEKGISIPPSIQDILSKLKAELLIPMVLHEEVMGILSLGAKKSDEGYLQDDLDILLPLARTLAIAISNAELFDELSKTQAEAAQKEKMAVIGTLSAGINHEICNPLGIARGQCEAFLLNMKDGLYNAKTPEELLEKAKEIMAKVIKETDRATAITKKLSSFAKPAKGEAELIDISREIDEAVGLVNYELKLEKIEFQKIVDDNLPGIFVDRKQFQEVLFNLIRNAGQAIGEKGKITIRAKGAKAKVYIDIQDTGIGIPDDKIKELFNPFFTTKDPGKGTGLGLFIVRQVVEKNGGAIYLKETMVGRGTTFTVEFPVAARQEARV